MKSKLSLIAILVCACTEEVITDRDYPRFNPLQVTGVTETTANFSAEIFYSSVTILENGFVYSNGGFPTLENGIKVSMGGPMPTAGTFTHRVTTLTHNQTYRVKAYAICADHVVYSNNVTFKTP